MNRRQLGFGMIGALALAVALPFAASAQDTFTVGYANLADSDAWLKTLKDSFEADAAAAGGMDVKFADANGDISKQLDQIDNFIAQGVDAIVVLPVDYDGIVPAVEKANEAGIPVLCLAIASNGGKYYYVGSSHTDAGKLQGEFMHDALPKDAKIVYLQGTLGLYHSNERLAGFTEALNRPDVTVIAQQSADYDRAKGMATMEDWIQSFEQIDGVIAANDQMALGAREALQAAGRTGVLIAGVDGMPDMLSAITDGTASFTVFQNAAAQAKAAVEVLGKIRGGEEVPEKTIVPFEPITKDNVADYMK